MLAYCIMLLAVLGVAGMAYGHGTGSETLPAVELDGRLVTMVVSSEQEEGIVRVDMSLILLSTGESIPDAGFDITARHGQTHLFSQEFRQGDGRIIFEMVEGASYSPPESISGGFFGILGPGSYRVAGPGLTGGGLYSFDITLLSADGHDPDNPPVFESAVSVPITYRDTISDRRWGDQTIQFITYYDALHDRGYDQEAGRMHFAMPFEWDADVIEQVETVHVEMVVPSAFGDLLSSDMEAHVNGVLAPDRTVTVDDYYMDVRTIHVVLPRGLLMDMLEASGDSRTMEFEVGARPDSPYSAVTSNGEYRMIVDTGPLFSGQEAAIRFNVTNVFLRSMNVEAPYAASVTHQGVVLHSQSGMSGQGSVLQFSIPGDISGVASVSFQDINGNELADASLPVFIDTPPAESVPPWIRETVGLWTSGMIDDGAFASAISYMVQQGVIAVGEVSGTAGDGGPIDEWVRTTAGWWVDGLVSDAEFLAGIKYMIERGVIAAP